MKPIMHSLEKHLLHVGTLFLTSMLFVACSKSAVEPTIPINKPNANEVLPGIWAGTYTQTGNTAYYINMNINKDAATGNLLALLNCQEINNAYNMLSTEGAETINTGVNKDSVIANFTFIIKDSKKSGSSITYAYRIRARFTNNTITGSIFISRPSETTIETPFTLTKQISKPYFGSWVMTKSEPETGSEKYVAEFFYINFFPMDKITASCTLPTWDNMGTQVNFPFSLYGTTTIINREIGVTTMNINNPKEPGMGSSIEHNPTITSGRFNSNYDTLFITFQRDLTYNNIEDTPKANYTFVKN